eukprot:CAMPEP_0184327594 /NCGR_PEP_ID=MMETSP1049-20130417/143175_1 /TAXON_ID=77928 /ORGANISM="Proteomonas sulcata, Strain CCMP704" /LENGTH=211 /DNA_ID=CAMNT_0026649855 /DNA_START=435 /DNA_END=1070 /DNA_ORIENTATION=+
MAIAVRVNKDREEEDSSDNNPAEAHPRKLAPYLPLLGISISLSYYLYRVATWPEGCSCLAWNFFECWGRFHAFDTKFAPISAMVIYGVTSLDVSARSSDGVANAENVDTRMGPFGRVFWQFLTWNPFVTVGKWGLPIFLYQAAVNVLVQGFLIDMHFGLEDRCHTTEFSVGYATFYVIFHIISAYAFAFMMNEDGPVGIHIHNAVKSITPK